MTNAARISDKTRGFARKATTDHKDLTGVFISAIVAAIIMRYVTAVTGPGAVHAVLAVVAVGAIVCAFVLLAKSKATAEWKLLALVGAAVVSGLCFALLTTLM